MRESFIKSPLFICAGEPSGDLYAGLLVKRLKKKIPHLKIFGVGGEEMEKNGIELVENYGKLMTFGFSVGITSLLNNYRLYKKISKKMYYVKPKTFVAVAYPGLNLLLCRYAKRLGCRVYYFLPPQIWAWGSFRKYFIKKWVDRVISVFPFEYQFYKKIDIETDYTINPLVGELKRYKRSDWRRRIGFMPGSRPNEIERNLPIVITLMEKINQIKPNVAFSLILPHHVENYEEVQNVLAKISFSNLNRVSDSRYQAMKNCDVLVISSGTASLEAAFMNIAQVFFNRPSFFDYFIFRWFLHIKDYNLANLYFGRKIVPSFVSHNKNNILQNIYKLIIPYVRTLKD